MGFNLRIGEATKDGKNVEHVYLVAAPADDVPTDHTNERWPSYTGWTDFYVACDLKDWFENRILKNIPVL